MLNTSVPFLLYTLFYYTLILANILKNQIDLKINSNNENILKIILQLHSFQL